MLTPLLVTHSISQSMETKSKSSPKLSAQYHAPAHDPFHLVLIICLILGCGTLLAYNALVSCATYFNHQFPNYPNIEFTIVPVFSIPNLIFIMLMIPFGDRLSWNVKILGCFSVLAVLVLSIPYISDPQWNIFGLSETGGYYAFLIIVAVIGCTSAVLQCSITAFCGLLPVKYLQTVLAGQSVSGILVCVIRIFSKLLLPLTSEGIEKSGELYFMVSSGVCIVCALSFYYARHSEFVQHHVSGLKANSIPDHESRKRRTMSVKMPSSRSVMNLSSSSSSQDVPKAFRRISLRSDFAMMNSPSPTDAERIEVFDPIDPTTTIRALSMDLPLNSLSIPIFNPFHDNDNVAPSTALKWRPNPSDDNEMNTKSYGAINTRNSEITSSSPECHVTHSKGSMKMDSIDLKESVKKYLRVFGKIGHLVGAIWLSMCFTFLWFPGVIVGIPSSFAVINDNGNWLPIIMILEFNVFDYIGRQFLCNMVPSWLTQYDLWKVSLLRMVTYPIFIVFFKQWVVSDVLLHCVMIVSALTNGYVASLSFMWFPKNVHRGNEQQIAASLMTLGLIMGILSGSTAALILQPFISM